jgi:hypothetical protein
LGRRLDKFNGHLYDCSIRNGNKRVGPVDGRSRFSHDDVFGAGDEVATCSFDEVVETLSVAGGFQRGFELEELSCNAALLARQSVSILLVFKTLT